jgi:hypothetical protein
MSNLVPLYIDKDTGKWVAKSNPSSGGGSSGGVDPLVWTENNNLRTLTGFIDKGVLQLVRSASFNPNNLLELVLATFSPTLSASPLPSTSLNWDVPANGFNISVANPPDFTTEYISSVRSITATTGSISPLENFTAGSMLPTPSGGISWTQQFTTPPSGYIRPISTTINGGSVNGVISFNYSTGSGELPFTDNAAQVNITWVTPTLTLLLGNLTGQTFLSSYTSTPYTITVSGINNVAAVCSSSVTPVGGNVNNPTSNGTFTFTVPITKDNISITRTLTCLTTFTRPVSVTGTSYTAQLSSSASILSAAFTYPSLYLWTASVAVVPTVSNIVNGTGFAAGVTQLGDQVKALSGYIMNNAVVPQAFWFAVKTSATQPTTFKTGASPSLLSDVSVTTGNSVSLQPTPLPSGYVPVSYNLYGIILQPGNTYVSIS